MRWINKIIVHCTATESGKNFHASDIDRWHRERGFSRIGYHFVVCLDGTIERGRAIKDIGAHCTGQNAHSIGIVYVGGMLDGVPADTRTKKQKLALLELIRELINKYSCPVYGHNDFAKKACPCFNAKAEYSFLYEELKKSHRLTKK